MCAEVHRSSSVNQPTAPVATHEPIPATAGQAQLEVMKLTLALGCSKSLRFYGDHPISMIAVKSICRFYPKAVVHESWASSRCFVNYWEHIRCSWVVGEQR